MLVNKDAYQRETLTKRPIRLPLNIRYPENTSSESIYPFDQLVKLSKNRVLPKGSQLGVFFLIGQNVLLP